jgi:hypothetical protein
MFAIWLQIMNDAFQDERLFTESEKRKYIKKIPLITWASPVDVVHLGKKRPGV